MLGHAFFRTGGGLMADPICAHRRRRGRAISTKARAADVHKPNREAPFTAPTYASGNRRPGAHGGAMAA
ncbi:hypothetical protein E2562_021050 [Oryza meyeriana var. granulata]|uniref:Uncharacterized protein n=1 Tax=Oryza meyeriana var. granulata TaxID=110450 RepID=A0A6G1FAY4_9ORYZ|nr:hypothetical protein E2562_021050 [Oryza meyeriana var. granulata]